MTKNILPKIDRVNTLLLLGRMTIGGNRGANRFGNPAPPPTQRQAKCVTMVNRLVRP